MKKQSEAFVNSLLTLTKEFKKSLVNLPIEDAKKLGLDSEEINKEAKDKVDELNEQLAKLRNRIKTV